MKKMIVFDLDGLLVDTEKTYFEGWLHVFKRNGIEFTRTDVLSWTGLSWLYIEKIIEKKVGSLEAVRKIRKEREEYVYEQLNQGLIAVKPYSEETLKMAREKKLVVSLASSTESYRGMRLLTHFGYEQYFDFLTFGDEVSVHKPDPAIYLLTLRKAQMLATDSFAVEDSIVGATAATKAGLEVFLIPDQSFERVTSKDEKRDLTLLSEGMSLELVYNYLKTIRTD